MGANDDKDDADFKISNKKLTKEEKRRLKEQAMQGPPDDDDEKRSLYRPEELQVRCGHDQNAALLPHA